MAESDKAASAQSEAWKERFLENLAASYGNACKSARECGKNRDQAITARGSDPDFAAKWDAIVEGHTDTLIEVMMRRAIEGDEQPIIRKGKGEDGKPAKVVVGTTRTFDTGLQVFLLRSLRSGQFNKAPGDSKGAGDSARDFGFKVLQAFKHGLQSVPTAPDESEDGA